MSDISNTSGTLSANALRSTAPTPAPAPRITPDTASAPAPAPTAEIGDVTATADADSIIIGPIERPDADAEVAATVAANTGLAEDNTENVDEDGDPLSQAAAAIEEILPNGQFPENTTLRIEQDEDTGRFIYKSIDNDTGEVVRQFPPEDILEVLALFRDPEGVILDDLA